MKRVLCATVLAAAILALVLTGTALASAAIYSSQQISSNSASQYGQFTVLHAAGDRVAWVKYIGTQSPEAPGLYTWTPSGGEEWLAPSDNWMRMSGDRIAWWLSGQVYTWTPAGGVVDLASGGDPDVSGDRLVWLGGSPYATPKTWTPTGGIVDIGALLDTWSQIGCQDIRVSGDRVVWRGMYGTDMGNDYEIFTWTPAGGIQQITTNNISEDNIYVTGDRITWSTYDQVNYEIYTWTPAGGVVRVTSDTQHGYLEGVSGDRIIWIGARTTGGVTHDFLETWTPAGGNVDVDSYVYDPNADAYYHSPMVDGDRVAWGDPTTDCLYTWTPTSGKCQATNVPSAQVTALSGDRLVWVEQHLENLAVYSGTPRTVGAPTVTSVAPALGPTVGGNSVVITGTNFDWMSGASAVTFGGTAATSYTVDSETQITAVVPAHAAGTVQAQVTAVGGSSANTAGDDYRYLAPPTITSVSPATGTGAGGTTVVIHGTGFEQLQGGAAAVKFGGANAASYTVDSLTQITAVTPGHVPGTVQVKVTTTGGESSDTAADDFKFTPSSGQSEQFTTTRLTTNSLDDDVPMVSGDRIVWAADDGHDYEIYTWTPSGGTVRITNNAYDDYLPRVDGDRIVWGGTGGTDGGSDWEIFTWTPSGGIVQVTHNSLDDEGAVVSGNRIAWMQGSVSTTNHQYKVWTWTPSGGSVELSSSSDTIDNLYPSVSGDRVAWLRGDSGIFYTWTASGGVSQIDAGTSHQVAYAAVSGDRIAALSTTNDIYMWTASGGGSWLPTGTLGGGVGISGDRVAWDALSGSIQQVFSWTPTEGVVQISRTTSSASSPEVSGDRVAWVDEGAGGADSEIWSWTPSVGALQVTNNDVDDVYPSVSGARLCWLDLLTLTNGEVYTAVAGPVLPQFENTDPHITYSPTASWTDYASTSASGSSYARASAANSSATVYFNGTRLDWIAMKGTTTGKADVYLDDVFKTTVDLSAGAATYKVNVWSTGTITAGVHKFSIVWNTGNAAGKYITLDRVDVQGSLVYGSPTITSLSPASGVLAGGTSVTINGTGFGDVSSVTFGGTSVPFTVVSPTKITTTAPAHAAGTVRVQVTTATGTTADTSADDFTYSAAPPTTRVDLPATTTGGLTLSGTWAAYSSASAYGASYLRSSTAGASVVITFKGTRLDWITLKGTTGAKADIYVDGSPSPAVTALDLYKSPAVYQQNVWSTGTLPDGWHTVKIVRNSTSASGRYLTLDAVEIAGTLQAPVRLEETSSAFTFSVAPATWTVGTTASASGGSYKYANTSNASVTFSFTGVGFKLIAKTAASYGNLLVTIDSGTAQTVSLYSSATTYKKVVLTAFLAPGTHTVTIARAGTKSSSSSGLTVDLDAIDLFGAAG